MHFTIKIALILSMSFLISSCAKVQKVEYAQSIEHPEDAYPAPIRFTNLRTQLPIGAEIGIHRHRCFLSFSEVGRHYLKGNIAQPEIKGAFVGAMEAQGFDIISRLHSTFKEEYDNELLRSEYKIGAKIIDAQINVCEKPNLIFNLPPITILDPLYLGIGGVKGKLYLKIEWAIYDNLRQKVAYKTVTEGYVQRKAKNKEGVTLMVTEAFSMAAHNLAANKHFHDLIFYGTKPPQDWRKTKKKESRPRIFDQQEKVVISNPPISKAPLTQHIDSSGEIAVLVQAGISHGSGYFITKQGHIITNAHVIGNAQRVRIVSAGKNKKMIAEVLRKSTKRDVALLKLVKIPEDFNIVTVPIKTEWPKVSEDIYALGAPSNKRLQDTLSKGIVSAHRKNFSVWGTKMDFIQGDVQTIGGNSGGPLLDANGNIVGMSVAGMYQFSTESDSGLNLFIPIEDALKYLKIELQ